MKTKVNLLKDYEMADASKRVDLICRYYPNFLGFVESYTEGLKYMIQNEKAYNRKKETGELGVRVQISGNNSDITANTAIENVMTKDAIISCDFSGDILEGTDYGEKYKRQAILLHRMRNDYELFNHQLGILSSNDSRLFLQYLTKEKEIADIADEKGIRYESVQQKILRLKKKIKIQMVAFIEGDIWEA